MILSPLAKGVKLLHFADLHLDAQFAWAGPVFAAKRRQALRDTLVRIVELAAAEHVDAILCGGDLYEQERFSRDTREFLSTTFARVSPIPVYISPGNHDWYGPSSLYRQAQWSANVTVFSSNQLEPVTLSDGLTLWGAAHRAPANTDGFLDQFLINRSGINIALFHGSEQAAFRFEEAGKSPHAPFRREQIAAARLAHAFVGHYHTPVDHDLYTYPGNPDPLTFGESGDRGAVVATIAANGAVSRKRHRVCTSDVSAISIDVTGCSNKQDARDRVRHALAARTGFVRATICGALDPDVELRADDLQDVARHLDGLVIHVGDVRAAYDFDAISDEPTVRGQFVRDVRSASISDEQKARVLTTGLRALAGRADLDVP